MKQVPVWMQDVWESGQFVGNNRPNGRATISKSVLSAEAGNFRRILFDSSEIHYEIPNIISINIDRRLGADAATCTIVFENLVSVDPNDNLDLNYQGGTESPTRRELRELSRPGYYTYRHGIAVGPDGTNPWRHQENPTWSDMFIPNRLVSVFQGYGTDGSGMPSQDSRLTLTGIFLIDSVQYGADGLVTLTCRDLAKLFIEQRLYPPIIPLGDYPLEICADHYETVTETFLYDAYLVPSPGASIIGNNVASHLGNPDSSVAPWYGYNGSVYGHRASHAFDGVWSSYWLSVGNNGPNEVWSYEWIGANTGGNWINRIQIRPKWGGYKCYVGIKQDGKWLGTQIVPYGATSGPAKPNGSNIPYVRTVNIPKGEEWFQIKLDFMYKADEIRLVFTNLAYSGLGTYPYRAGIYDMNAFAETTTTVYEEFQNEGTREVEQFVEGNIDDYTEIVKLFSAWAGFWWPNGPADPFFSQWGGGGSGRVWGDFFYSGAYPVDPPCIPPSYWDNKSIMDGINQIKEILGFIFYIDSYGGVVWRPPNIWKTGNFITGVGYIGEDSILEIDEEKVLMDFGVTIDDANLRSDIIVVSADDPSVYGAYSPGFASGETLPSASDQTDSALLGGQQRIMLVPNYPFGTAGNPQSKAEVEKFAFLVSLWIHWSYRRGRVRIPGYPALEPDDQIRMKERVTSDTYIHYIQGLSSQMDLKGGTWYMDLDTHWLGSGPDDTWIINAKDMHPALFAYLLDIGQISTEVENDTSKWPDSWFEYQPPTVPDDLKRLDGDLSTLFPLPPGVTWPSADFDFESDYDSYSEPPSGGGGGGGGVVFLGSNKAMSTYWGPGPLTGSPGTSPSCDSTKIKSYRFLRAYDGGPGNTHINQTSNINISIDYRAWPAFAKLVEIICEEQWNVKQGGGYFCRGVYKDGGYSTQTWSNHAWGTAVDFNWDDHPYGKASTSSVLTRIGRRAVDQIRTGNGKQVFVWGGNWSTPDPMHFQVTAIPSDLATGVIRTDVTGPF